MKKLFVFLSIVLISVSCKTPLYLADIPENQTFGIIPSVQHPNSRSNDVEYIGVLNHMQKSRKIIKDIGEKLEKQNLAHDAQGYYARTIHPDELAKYKSQHRYVTYLDFDMLNYYIDDDVDYNAGLNAAAWIVAGSTIFTLFPVYIPLFCCVDKNTCRISLIVTGNLVVYDTEEQSITNVVPIDVKRNDYLKGKYYHKKTDRDAIDNYYQSLVDKAIIDAYKSINSK